MDADQFDRMVRAIGSRTRRQLMTGGLAAAFGALGGIRDAAAGKRCPKRKRCGRDCCEPELCFVTQNGKPFCCKGSKGKVCPDIRDLSGASDQCCYSFEVCSDTFDPDWQQWGPCCRECGESCCIGDTFRCNKSGQCYDTGVARTARFRR